MLAAAGESSQVVLQWQSVRRVTVCQWQGLQVHVPDWPVESLMQHCSVSLASVCHTLPSTSFDFAASCARCALAPTILTHTHTPVSLPRLETGAKYYDESVCLSVASRSQRVSLIVVPGCLFVCLFV